MSKSHMSQNGRHWRFHMPHSHLNSAFGDDWFGLKAEAFARFFGTPIFLVGQTVIVLVWIGVNLAGWTNFDLYPFILLNLAFSLQAAYAAPLILLAETRQADRDKAQSEADAMHREELHRIAEERQEETGKQTGLMIEMLRQNNHLTEQINDLAQQNVALTRSVHQLTERIEALTIEMRDRLAARA